MKYTLFVLCLITLVSCSNKSPYTKACASNPNSGKQASVSGKEISVTKVSKNTYRNYSRRPHKLGLLRR